MSGLRIYRSNQLERLAVALAAMLTEQLPQDPFAHIDILVGSRGMERWLRHRISEHSGICAQIRFQFPARFVEDRLKELEGDQEGDPSLWSGQSIVWNLLELWSDEQLLSDPVYKPLKEYLHEDDPGVVSRRRYSLASKLGEIFDRYAVFRPTWATEWSRRRDAIDQPKLGNLEWQKHLWHRLTECVDAGESPKHMASRLNRAVRGLKSMRHGEREHPLYVFGVSSLPPLWLEFLAEVSHTRPIDLFLFSPSNQYWGELQRCALAEWRHLDRDHIPEALRKRRASVFPERPQGHPLLASLGRVGRDTQIVLESLSTGYVELDLDLFHDPIDRPQSNQSPDTPKTLHWLQSDILHMRTPEECMTLSHTENRVPMPQDDSIQLHLCHGALRQVEVLRDILLGLFANYPHLEPRDVVVMTPDIERYAPLISSVFDRGFYQRRRDAEAQPHEDEREAWGSAGGPRIPFQIADLTVRRMNPVADVLMRALALAGGRMEASTVADLLQLEPVQLRFNFQPEDLSILHQWIGESGIRWGRDAEHRAEHQQPSILQNTWRFGLNRLLVGVTTADEDQSISGVLPYDDMEGQSVVLLGKFVNFTQTLFQCITELSTPKTPEDWVKSLEETVDLLTDTTSKSAWLSRRVRDVLNDLNLSSQRCQQLISTDAIYAELEGRFEIPDMTPKTQNGAVSFCALRPMRGIPYRVVCLLGMDEGSCPRPTSKAAFDLCAMYPRIGDTHPRDDDRYMVLEALLSAREHFLMLYTGRSETTNEVFAPAVPVGEIMEVLDRSFPSPPGAESVSEHLTYSHPLQPFSPRNFQAGAIHPGIESFSFAGDQMFHGTDRVMEDEDSAFFKASSPQERPLGDWFELDRIQKFFKHPIRYLLSQELKLSFYEKDDRLKDREPVELDGLAQWTLRTQILAELTAGGDGEAAYQRCLGDGSLPLGQSGRTTFDTAQHLAMSVHSERLNFPPRDESPLRIDTLIGPHRITGQVTSIAEDALIYAHPSPLRDKHLMAAWIDLLAAHASTNGQVNVAILINSQPVRGRPQAKVTRLVHPSIDPNPLLSLLELYSMGQRSPLLLLPKSSPDFVRGRQGRGSKTQLLRDVLAPHHFADRLYEEFTEVQKDCLLDGVKKATSAYEKGDFCDALDPYIQHMYGVDAPFSSTEYPLGIDPVFAMNALKVWAPILSAEARGESQ